MRSVAVIGAGPAGLAAAYELLSHSGECRVTVFEKEEVVGGLSRTFAFEGGRVDVGGHRYFSKNQEVLDLWDEILPEGEEGMLVRPRSSHILWDSKLIDYPIKMNAATLGALGLVRGAKVLASYLRAQAERREVKSLEDFYIDRFGKELYALFFEDYTSKLWGIPASELSPDWGSQRVRKLTLGSLLGSALAKPKCGSAERSLISEFRYPAFGAGQMWEALAERVVGLGGVLKTGCCVTGLGFDGSQVRSVDYVRAGETCREAFDYVISTMPLRDLALASKGMPAEVSKVCGRLCYRDMMIVALELPRACMGKAFQAAQGDSWIYMQDGSLTFGRCQILNNWSPCAVSNSDSVVLELEYFCGEGDALWEMDDAALVLQTLAELVKCGLCLDSAEVRSCLVERIRKAYPVYVDGYHQLDVVECWLDGIDNLVCAGRNGLHRYNNMDHSVESGLKAARTFFAEGYGGKRIWEVNSSKEYLEE